MYSALGAALVLVSSGLAAADFTGHWEGTATHGDETTPVVVDLEADHGTVGLPGLEVLGIPFEFDSGQSQLTFTLQIGGMAHTFILEGRGERLAGTWTVDEPAKQLTLDLARTADSRPYTEEEITFHSDIKLSGTVFVPKTAGPHPGIALIHGSGDNLRWVREYYADFFARQGFAVVFFDKRGNGGSEGNWREVGFEPLARDGIAALDYLASRDDIREDALGFWGISQAGWIMNLAATLSDRVGFLIITSGATVDVEEEIYYDYMVQLRDSGYGEDVQEQMLAILKQDTHVTRTAEGYEELRAMVEPVRREPWFRGSGFLATPPNFVMRRFMREIIDFNPQPYIKQLEIPVLWLYGEADKSVEPSRNIEILEGIMAGGDYDFTIKTFPEADHGIRVAPRADAIVPVRLAAPGYWETIAQWLKEQDLSQPIAE